MKEEPKLTEMPEPPVGSTFALQKVETITTPHPFMITPRHVCYASDRGGRLGTEEIRASKAPCGWNNCQLSIDEHESLTTLFIQVLQNKDLNAIPGLHTYLYSNKARFVELGIDGFAFPTI